MSVEDIKVIEAIPKTVDKGNRKFTSIYIKSVYRQTIPSIPLKKSWRN